MACHDPRDYVLGQDLRVRILTTGQGLTAAPNQCNSKSHEIVCVHSAFAFLNTAKSQLRNAAPGRSIAPPTRHR
jgi:hypothetical protein